MNKLKFDSSGLISGVDPTPYDFEGKVDALELICREVGCTLDEAVFVGEGFNDETVAARAGLSIAFPPTSQAVSSRANVEIREDDLFKILDHVL